MSTEKIYEIHSKSGFSMKGTFRQLAKIVGTTDQVGLFSFMLDECSTFYSETLGITFNRKTIDGEPSEVWIVFTGMVDADSIDSVHRSQESAEARFCAIDDSADSYLTVVKAPWNS